PRLERNLHTVADFKRHLEILRRFTIIPSSDLADNSALSRTDRPLVIVTFDDGYASNLIAHELLRRHHIPWTLFVTTACVGTDQTIWTGELALLILCGEASQIDLFDQTWPLVTRLDRERVFQDIRYRMKRLLAAERRAASAQLRHQFPAGETSRLLERFPA